MKNYKYLLVVGLLIATTPVVGQISKTEAQAFVSAHKPSDVKYLYVIRKIDYHTGNNDFAKDNLNFDTTTAKIAALDKSLRITDGTGADTYVPYTSIKCLTYQPETEKLYARISILVQ